MAGEILEPTDRRPGRAVVPGGRRRLQPRLLGGDRDLRRGRRQSRPGAAELARRAGGRAGGDALRGARFDRRPDAGRHRAGRRPGDQPRPDVALPGGRGQPLAGVDVARHPDPVRARARCGWTRSASGCRPRCSPGSTRSGRCGTSCRPAATHSWFLLDSKTIGPEFGLSGSEQNPDFAEKSVKLLLTTRAGGKITPPVQAFLDKGVDFLTAPTVAELVGQDERPGRRAADRRRRGGRRSSGCGTARCARGWARIRRSSRSRAARRYFGDRRMRTAEPHEMLDPAAGPLIAVRLHILTRKTLGGLETDLSARVLQAGRQPGRRAVRGRRGGRIRRRRDARLPGAGGIVPRWVPVLRADRRPGRGGCGQPV